MSTERIISRVVSRAVRPLRGLVRGLARRGTLTALQSGQGQAVDVDGPEGDSDGGVDLLEPYGFTSSPGTGAQGLLIRVGGQRAATVGMCFNSRSDRFSDLASGEVAVYNRSGCSIVLRNSGAIEVTPGPGQQVLLGGQTATLPVARSTDSVEPGYLMTSWASIVETAINSLAPGTFTPANNFAGTIGNLPNAFGTIAQRTGEGARCV